MELPDKDGAAEATIGRSWQLEGSGVRCENQIAWTGGGEEAVVLALETVWAPKVRLLQVHEVLRFGSGLGFLKKMLFSKFGQRRGLHSLL